MPMFFIEAIPRDSLRPFNEGEAGIGNGGRSMRAGRATECPPFNEVKHFVPIGA